EGAVPKLATGVIAPALHCSGGGDRAGVLDPGRYGGDPGGEPGHVHRDGACAEGAVPQLAAAVVTPALRSSEGGECAGVGELPREHGGPPGGEPGPVHGGGAVCRGAVPQLAVDVVAPAFQPT